MNDLTLAEMTRDEKLAVLARLRGHVRIVEQAIIFDSLSSYPAGGHSSSNGNGSNGAGSPSRPAAPTIRHPQSRGEG